MIVPENKMKTIILFVSFVLTNTLFAADSLQTTVSKATVFLSGAQVFRESQSFPIKKGVNEVVITDGFSLSQSRSDSGNREG